MTKYRVRQIKDAFKMTRGVPNLPSWISDNLDDSELWASYGDYVVMDTNGKLSVCDGKTFEAIYEPVEELECKGYTALLSE